MTTRPRRTRSAAVLLAVLAAVVTGCGHEPPQPRRVEVPAMPPSPAGAKLVPADAPPPGPEDKSCGDPTMTLRPGADPSGPTVDAVRQRGMLRVGLDPGSNLFSFRNPVSGQLDGFDVDLAKQIALDLFGDPTRVEFRMLGSGERETELQDGSVDVVVKTMSITCARRAHVTFSAPYLVSHQRVLAITKSGIGGLEDLANRRVCVVDGTTSLDRIRRKQPAAQVMTVPAWADCMVALQQREVDAISTDGALLAGLVAQDRWYTEVVGGYLSDEPYGVGIPPGHDDMVRFVNHTLERVRGDGTWQAMYDHWLRDAIGDPPNPPEPRYQD